MTAVPSRIRSVVPSVPPATETVAEPPWLVLIRPAKVTLAALPPALVKRIEPPPLARLR